MTSRTATQFESDFKQSEKQELRNYWVVLQEFPILEFTYINNEEKRKGKDKYDFEIVNSTTGSRETIDFKNWKKVPREKIVIETKHDINEDVDGWIWYGEFDWLAAIWHNDKNYNYIILDFRALRAWWNEIQLDPEKKAKYKLRTNKPTKRNGVITNQSEYALVPINEIPESIIKSHKKQFSIDEFW